MEDDGHETIAELLLDALEESEELERRTNSVIAWIETLPVGRITPFLESLYDQYETKGTLSEKQVEVAEKIRRDMERISAKSKTTATKVKPLPVEIPIATAPAVTVQPGFYGADNGKLYRVDTDERISESTGSPEIFGGPMRWFLIDELPESQRLSLDNVVGFGLIYGSCIVCGEEIPDGNIEGIHAHCAFRLPTMFGYIPEPRVVEE